METAIKLEKRIGNHIYNGNFMEEIESPSKRRFLKGLLGAGVIAVTPKLAFAQRRKKISDEARNRIWANYPEMQGAIDLINDNYVNDESVDDVLIDYAMYPDQGYYSPRGIPTSIDKISSEDMDTPHYWLLLKIHADDDYNFFADEDGDPGLDVPPPPSPPSGVWYFARGLRDNSPDNESDLLKSLYVGATGSPQGAEPIINGTFMNASGVREKVREWKEKYDFAPFSDEGNHLLAYNVNILRNVDFRDKELVELSLLTLADFYDRTNSPERRSLYRAWVIEDLTEKGKLPEYSIIERDGSIYVVRDPLPRLRF